MDKYKDVWLLEPALCHKEGHLLETALCLKEAFGERLTIFGNRAFDIHDNRIVRFFSPTLVNKEKHGSFRRMRFVWRICRLLEHWGTIVEQKSFAAELAGLKKTSFGTLLFFPSLEIPRICGVIEYMGTVDVSCDAAIILRYIFLREDVEKLFDLVMKSPARDRIFFFSDSEKLISYYREAGLDNVTLLPIPHLPSIAPKEPGSKLRIAYLGGARLNKGFHLLPPLIRGLQSEQLEFAVQSSHVDITWEHEIDVVEKCIEEMDELGVELYHEPFTSEQYYSFLNSADIVLLPYDNDIKVKRYWGTSGILTEAMALGKVAVVPANTWLSDQILKSGGGTIFKNSSDFPEKVKEAVLNFPTLKKRAMDYINTWRNIHNIEKYCNILLNSGN